MFSTTSHCKNGCHKGRDNQNKSTLNVALKLMLLNLSACTKIDCTCGKNFEWIIHTYNFDHVQNVLYIPIQICQFTTGFFGKKNNFST